VRGQQQQRRDRCRRLSPSCRHLSTRSWSSSAWREAMGAKLSGGGSRVEGRGLRVEGLGSRVEGRGSRVEGRGFEDIWARNHRLGRQLQLLCQFLDGNWTARVDSDVPVDVVSPLVDPVFNTALRHERRERCRQRRGHAHAHNVRGFMPSTSLSCVLSGGSSASSSHPAAASMDGRRRR